MGATSDRDSALDRIAAPPVIGEQLTLHLDLQKSADKHEAEVGTQTRPVSLKSQAASELQRQRQLWQREQEALMAELTELRSLTQEQVNRIRNLEQALDQSLKSLNELRLQVVDQEFLETQLASTEEISNVQQQAITRLKLQLTQQQQDLEAQLAETQERDLTLQDLLTTLEELAQAQQSELERLRAQIAHDRVEVQVYQGRLEKRLGDLQTAFNTQQQRVTELESQALSARVLSASLEVWLEEAQAQVQELAQQLLTDVASPLQKHQTTLERLDIGLRQVRSALQDQHVLGGNLPESQSIHALAHRPLEQELAIAQGKIEELEIQIAKQLTTEAMLQHACQELEAERDRQQLRLTDLERQTADMQEQILQQAQQASEYETAVQHWKDRYLKSAGQVQQLKALVEQVIPNPPHELAELLAALQSTITTEPSRSALLAVSPPNSNSQIDLPDFLLRRRNKARRP